MGEKRTPLVKKRLPWVFFAIFTLYKWYQIAQRIYKMMFQIYGDKQTFSADRKN